METGSGGAHASSGGRSGAGERGAEGGQPEPATDLGGWVGTGGVEPMETGGGAGAFGGSPAGGSPAGGSPSMAGAGAGPVGGEGGGGAGAAGGGSSIVSGGELRVWLNLPQELQGLGEAELTIEVLVSGPEGYSETLSKSRLLTGLKSGEYRVTARPALRRGAIISELFDAKLSDDAVLVSDDVGASVTVSYERRAGSGRLLVVSQGKLLLSASAAQLAGTGTVGASLTPLEFPQARAQLTAVTTDARGNVWVGACGPGASDDVGGVFRFSGAQLESGGVQQPEVAITLNVGFDFQCVSALEFDSDGNLFVADDHRGVFLLTPSQLSKSGHVVPNRSVIGLWTVRDLVFDSAHNLWFSMEGGQLVGELAEASVHAGDNDLMDLATTWQNRPGEWDHLFAPRGMELGPDGRLWVADYARGEVSGFALAATAAEQPELQVASSNTKTPTDLGFDESGDLWVLDADERRIAHFESSKLASRNLITPLATFTLNGELSSSGGALRFNPRPSRIP